MLRIQNITTILVTCLTIFLSFSDIQAQSVRKFSNAFLDIGVGARGLAMSNSITATTGDVTSGYWNPAGLTQIEENFQLAAMHAEYFAGIAKYDYAALALPLKSGNQFVGLSFIRFGVDDIPNTLNLFEDDGSINYDNIRSFSVGDYGFLFSYAQKLKVEGLSLGGNVKIVYRQAGSFATAWGFGLDLGAQYRLKQLRLGIMARDITSTFNAWSFGFTDEEKKVLVATGNEIPESSLEITVPKFDIGVAYEFVIKDKFTILPEINFEISTDGKRNVPIKTNSVSIDPRFGLEMNYVKIVYLRFGVGNIQSSTDDFGESITTWQPNMGIGLKIKSFGIDYAFTDIGNQSDGLYSHVFSLNLSINKKQRE